MVPNRATHHIYEFDNAITFNHQSISLFWYLDTFLEKDKTGLPLHINTAWSVFIGLINWRGLLLSHIWTIQLSSLNFNVHIRFIIFLQISCCFFYLLTVTSDKRFVHWLHIFMIFVSSWRACKRFKDWRDKKLRTGGVLLCWWVSTPFHAMIGKIWINYHSSQII